MITYDELQKVLHSRTAFANYLINLLYNTDTTNVDLPSGFKGVPLVEYGSDDGYYWDTTYAQLNADGETLTVTFDAGSTSGWVPTDFTEYEVTIEQFRQYLLNRKWANKSIDTIQLLFNSIESINGSHIVEERYDD